MQTIRIRELFDDFEADYFVVDARNSGSQIVINLGKVLFDEERQIDYSPMKAMNNDTYSGVVADPNAKECIYTINATQQLNSDMAYAFRRNLQEGRINFLVTPTVAKDEILLSNKDYANEFDVDKQFAYEKPFYETQALISETAELLYEKNPQTGTIKVHEKGANTKDRYVAAAMGSYFIDQLEMDLVSNSSDYEYTTLIN